MNNTPAETHADWADAHVHYPNDSVDNTFHGIVPVSIIDLAPEPDVDLMLWMQPDDPTVVHVDVFTPFDGGYWGALEAN